MAQSDDNMDLWLRALSGELTAEERLRLDRDDPEFAELEAVAAAYDLARSEQSVEPMPEHLAERIRAEAVLPAAEPAPATVAQISPQPATQARSQSAGLAWFAAAACLIAAIADWWPQAPEPVPAEPTVAELRVQLAAEDPEVVQFALAGTEDPAAGDEAQGSVVWSQADQRGYMTIRNLAPNDPSQSQYQLWIFDGTREKHPVDGGVFDVNEAGEVVIPIDPKLPVGQPTLFAITVERPGGVVVSDQGRIAMVGKVGA